MKPGHFYGIHRVIEPKGVLPQPAWKLDAESPLTEHELLIDVERLNIDSASFRQLREEAGGRPERIKEKIAAIIAERGKMHNPATGSGGMLIGRVKRWGSAFPAGDLRVGDRIASLVSLTLTPLRLRAIHGLDMETGQVEVEGEAILFASGLWARLPPDLPEKAALAALDVCGAPAQTKRLVQEGARVLILGAGGKSGILSLYQASKNLAGQGQLIALEYDNQACARLQALPFAGTVLQADARDPVALLERVHALTGGELCDVVISCVNVPHAEMSAILSTRDGGTIYFFSMATSFAAAALGAEGVGKDVRMLIGNGYAPGHAELTFSLLRESPPLYQYFAGKFAGLPSQAQ